MKHSDKELLDDVLRLQTRMEARASLQTVPPMLEKAYNENYKTVLNQLAKNKTLNLEWNGQKVNNKILARKYLGDPDVDAKQLQELSKQLYKKLKPNEQAAIVADRNKTSRQLEKYQDLIKLEQDFADYEAKIPEIYKLEKAIKDANAEMAKIPSPPNAAQKQELNGLRAKINDYTGQIYFITEERRKAQDKYTEITGKSISDPNTPARRTEFKEKLKQKIEKAEKKLPELDKKVVRHLRTQDKKALADYLDARIASNNKLPAQLKDETPRITDDNIQPSPVTASSTIAASPTVTTTTTTARAGSRSTEAATTISTPVQPAATAAATGSSTPASVTNTSTTSRSAPVTTSSPASAQPSSPARTPPTRSQPPQTAEAGPPIQRPAASTTTTPTPSRIIYGELPAAGTPNTAGVVNTAATTATSASRGTAAATASTTTAQRRASREYGNPFAVTDSANAATIKPVSQQPSGSSSRPVSGEYAKLPVNSPPTLKSGTIAPAITAVQPPLSTLVQPVKVAPTIAGTGTKTPISTMAPAAAQSTSAQLQQALVTGAGAKLKEIADKRAQQAKQSGILGSQVPALSTPPLPATTPIANGPVPATNTSGTHAKTPIASTTAISSAAVPVANTSPSTASVSTVGPTSMPPKPPPLPPGKSPTSAVGKAQGKALATQDAARPPGSNTSLATALAAKAKEREERVTAAPPATLKK